MTFKVTFTQFYITYWSVYLSIEIHIKLHNKPKTQTLEIFLIITSLVLKSSLPAWDNSSIRNSSDGPQLDQWATFVRAIKIFMALSWDQLTCDGTSKFAIKTNLPPNPYWSCTSLLLYKLPSRSELGRYNQGESHTSDHSCNLTV